MRDVILSHFSRFLQSELILSDISHLLLLFRLHATDELVGAVVSKDVSEGAEVVPLVVEVLGKGVAEEWCKVIDKVAFL